MLNNNQVVLLGRVTDSRHIRSLLTDTGRLIRFELRTSERWCNRGRQQDHYEYHQIVARDNGVRYTASRSRDFIVPGQMLLVMGTLRHHYLVGSDLKGSTVTEVDAHSIEALVEQRENVEAAHAQSQS